MRNTKILLLLLLFSSCVQNENKMITPKNANKKFAEFIAKKKFVDEDSYPGIADEKDRPIFTSKINQSATDFKNVSESDNPTEKKYQEQIGIGLLRFADVYMDTEDKERLCTYFEELMDIVELESSNGQLNEFLYGFDPSELQ